MPKQAYPGVVAYESAIQNPDKFFLDSELRQAKFAQKPGGGTKLITGNYAIVYKVELPSGTYALRVFHKQPLPEMKDRYEAISSYLSRFSAPYFVEYRYLDNEVLAQGERRPVILMKWVNGISLDEYINQYHQDTAAMLYLAGRFFGVVAGLIGLKMSHCDWQGGNAIFDPTTGEIILVDYDDTFAPIPPLIGSKSNGLGKEDYQHPKRKKLFFCKDTDNFSQLLIYFSFALLSKKPELYGKFNNGDNIIFTKQDFLDPGNTPAWKEARTLNDKLVDGLMDILVDACKKGPDELSQIPNLVDVINDIGEALPPGKRPAIQAQPTVIPPATPTTTRPQTPTTTTSTARPIAILPVSQHNFGPVVEGTATPDWNLEVKNDRSAQADLVIQSVVASDPHVSVSYTPRAVKPGDNFFIAVKFDLTGVSTAQPARITETVTVDTNDKQLTVDVICDVVPTPKPALMVPGMYSFPDALIGSSATWELEIRNTGAGDLQNLSVSCPDPAIRISPYPTTIAAGATEKVTIVYEPSLAGDLDTIVTISSSNAPAQDIRLTAHVSATGIRRIVPNDFILGDAKDIVVEGVGFVQERRPYDIWTGQGRNRIKKTEYTVSVPFISFSASVFVADIQFISPTALRASVSVPKTCVPDNYDIIVTNPDGSQIVGKGMLVIQALPTGQVRCPHCNGLTTSTKWCDKCGLPLRSSVLQKV